MFLPCNILASSSLRIRGRAAAREAGARTSCGKDVRVLFNRVTYFCLSIAVGLVTSSARSEAIWLDVRGVPDHGIAMVTVDLTAAARWCGFKVVDPHQLKAEIRATGESVPTQFVTGRDFDPRERIVGLLVMRLPGGGDWRLRLTSASGASPKRRPWAGTVSTPFYRIRHDAAKMGGLPCRIEFVETGKVFDSLRWNDRCYDPTLGGYSVRNDRQPRLELVSDGPLCTAVRVAGRYLNSAHKPPASRAVATYTWLYFRDLPLVYVTADIEQTETKEWKEVHFLELNFPGKPFDCWAGGDPLESGELADSGASHRLSKWGLIHDRANAIGMLQAGQVLVYDGKDGYGKYLHARGTRAWQPWAGQKQTISAWLWIDATTEPAAAVQEAAARLPNGIHVSVSVERVEHAIESARNELARGELASDTAWWRIAAAEQLRTEGLYRQAIMAANGQLPDTLTVMNAGQLGMLVEKFDAGLRLLSLFDIQTHRQLTAATSVPLFEVALRDTATKNEVKLCADSEWRDVSLEQSKETLTIRWTNPTDTRLTGLHVVARAAAHAHTDSIAWSLEIEGQPQPWALWEVTFPQVAATDFDGAADLLLPIGSGALKRVSRNRGLQSRTRYPSGWTSMQFMAINEVTEKTGLYVAMHDPWGSTKTVIGEIGSPVQGVTLGFAHPVPNMGRGGNRFSLCGVGVWRLLRGNWFDAAVVYRTWVRQHAHWFPKLTADGRADTPRWMRELCCWAMGGDDPRKFADVNKRLQKFLGVPIGVHWYRWHQIPFDNDYPHYFPTVPGFTEAVADLQRNHVFVMPYINGRLWDTRDRGTEDFEFSKVALPATTKDEAGKPYIEMYGSKERDGERVRLATMCPSTELWQTRVRDIVLRLMNQCGVRGVYIDQVAAAQPRLCFDATHDHPLGGGHWWTESYWKLLQAIRHQMPPDRILTTECNAEPYVHCFDGYLTWHWQYDGQVPAFPAVYGGAIQMFGRAYRGGPTKDLAFRMKAGQQLVFGEQIGWMNPSVVDEPENAAFLKQIVLLRYHYRRFFHAGEMARPPKLNGPVPTVTADWQWHGTWPVTTPAVMTGAWRIPRENRAVLLFVNVSDQAVATSVRVNPSDYVPDAQHVHLTVRGREGSASLEAGAVVQRALHIAGRTAVAWELEE